jgi:hypothetical protein
MCVMTGGRHTIEIGLEASEGPPTGVISVDGGRRRTFCGWIDLIALLEALMAEPDLKLVRPPARADRAPHT